MDPQGRWEFPGNKCTLFKHKILLLKKIGQIEFKKIEPYPKHPQEAHISGSPAMNVLSSEEMFHELKRPLQVICSTNFLAMFCHVGLDLNYFKNKSNHFLVFENLISKYLIFFLTFSLFWD